VGDRPFAVVYVGRFRIERIYNHGPWFRAASERPLDRPAMIAISPDDFQGWTLA